MQLLRSAAHPSITKEDIPSSLPLGVAARDTVIRKYSRTKEKIESKWGRPVSQGIILGGALTRREKRKTQPPSVKKESPELKTKKRSPIARLSREIRLKRDPEGGDCKKIRGCHTRGDIKANSRKKEVMVPTRG